MTYEPPHSPAGLPPTKVHLLTANYTDLADASSITVGSRSTPGYALSYHLGTTGGAPPIASDLDWRFAYDGEASASHSLVAIGDSIATPSEARSTPHHGDQWTKDADSDAWSYVAYQEPIPYDSVSVELHNPSGANSPEGWVAATVADKRDIPPLKQWRRHADGNEDQTLSDGASTTLVSTSGRGRFYGFWMDIDGSSAYDQDMEVYIDGEASPSISINSGHVASVWRNEESVGSGTFGIGEYTSGDGQITHYFTPGHMGVYSDFDSSLSVDIVNNSGAGGIEMDWGVVWDEAV